MPMQKSLSGGQAIALGTFVVGCADALDAMLFFGLRNGVAPGRIFQSIASGLLGQAAYAARVGARRLKSPRVRGFTRTVPSRTVAPGRRACGI
jgi:hypothetical protein